MHPLAAQWIERVALSNYRSIRREPKKVHDAESNLADIWRVYANNVWHTCEVSAGDMEEQRYCDGNGLLLIEYPDSGWSFWRSARLHRTDGPAIRSRDGVYRWMCEGCVVDMSPQPNVLSENGLAEWRDHLTGALHALSHPAQVKPDGSEYWYRYGVLTRDDGPAITTADGLRKWVVNGKTIKTEHPDGMVIYYDESGDIRRIKHAE